MFEELRVLLNGQKCLKLVSRQVVGRQDDRLCGKGFPEHAGSVGTGPEHLVRVIANNATQKDRNRD